MDIRFLAYMRILVDMDSVIADFEKGVLDTYRRCHPDKPFIPLEQRTLFFVEEQYPEDLQPLIREILLSKGFFFGLPPIEGAFEALLEMKRNGDDVSICTRLMPRNPFCRQEKYYWVMRYLNKEWAEDMIVTKDKTRFSGNILVDDNPRIRGRQKPVWEHILYSQPYNMNVNSKRRLTWQNWKSVIYF